MNGHDLLWLAALAFGAWNAWQSKTTHNAILRLELKLVNRIAAVEGDVKALQAVAANKSE